jgi:ubiquitin C-terminal hydrolase
LLDFKWDDDNPKLRVTISKRMSLATLPEVLIFHLNRFEVNYETLINEKLNDSFSFPFQLNMYRYTKEGLQNDNSNDDSYYDYELCGVVVHSVC